MESTAESAESSVADGEGQEDVGVATGQARYRGDSEGRAEEQHADRGPRDEGTHVGEGTKGVPCVSGSVPREEEAT